MSKKDKKFIAVLMFLQTGIIVATISISGKFWYESVGSLIKLNNLQEITAWLNGENREFESKDKIQKIKKHYETKGIEVEEN